MLEIVMETFLRSKIKNDLERSLSSEMLRFDFEVFLRASSNKYLLSDTVSCGQNMIVINERPTTKLSVAIHQSGLGSRTEGFKVMKLI